MGKTVPIPAYSPFVLFFGSRVLVREAVCIAFTGSYAADYLFL